jgi:hypothetical protein
MCCIITTLMLFGPRLGILIWWLYSPVYFNLVINSFFLAILGWAFLPWTTLMYLAVYGVNGIVGFDYAFILLGLLADVATYGGGVHGNRKQIAGYVNDAAAEPTPAATPEVKE